MEELSERAKRALEALGWSHVEQVVSERELYRVHKAGRRTVKEIRDILKDRHGWIIPQSIQPTKADDATVLGRTAIATERMAAALERIAAALEKGPA